MSKLWSKVARFFHKLFTSKEKLEREELDRMTETIVEYMLPYYEHWAKIHGNPAPMPQQMEFMGIKPQKVKEK